MKLFPISRTVKIALVFIVLGVITTVLAAPRVSGTTILLDASAYPSIKNVSVTIDGRPIDAKNTQRKQFTAHNITGKTTIRAVAPGYKDVELSFTTFVRGEKVYTLTPEKLSAAEQAQMIATQESYAAQFSIVSATYHNNNDLIDFCLKNTTDNSSFCSAYLYKNNAWMVFYRGEEPYKITVNDRQSNFKNDYYED